MLFVPVSDEEAVVYKIDRCCCKMYKATNLVQYPSTVEHVWSATKLKVVIQEVWAGVKQHTAYILTSLEGGVW